MVLLPALKIGLMKKYAQKTKVKMAHDELKPRKKHTHPNKSTNIGGVSDVEFSAESNGVIHGAKKTAKNGLKNIKMQKK